MNYINLLCYSLLGISLSNPTGSPYKEEPPKWSGRGIFAFGPLLLDFHKDNGIEVVLNRSRNKLDNCSNDNFYCARSRNVNIVLPRKCPDSLRVGETWHVGEVSMSVLYSGNINPPLRKVLAKTYLLGSERNPNIVWTYRLDTGINGVYFDSNNKENLVDLARNGGTEILNQRLSQKRYGFFELFTLDAFGFCHT